MTNKEVTEKFLNSLRKYFNGEISIDEAVKESGLKSRKQFQFKIKTAYKNNYLTISRLINTEKCDEVKNWIRRTRGIAKDIEVFIVNDIPEDETFFSNAAEKFLGFLKDLLEREDKEKINIGIVSGTSATDTVEYAIKEGFWQEVMEGAKIKGRTRDGKQKKINIVAICSTTLDEWDLDGNANISTLSLAKMLVDNLSEDFKVTPHGISTEIIVTDENLKEVDERDENAKILNIVDPSRINPNSEEKSSLDILIAGVGSSKDEKNVFQRVITKKMGIELPEVVGDVGFWPIDEEGNVVEICDKDKKRKYMVYSLITPKIMKQLAGGDGIVILIARNHRHGEEVSKTKAIRAAIRGGFGNVIITDEDTANELIREPL